MVYEIKFRRRAVQDLGEAYEWYEEQREGLGEEFLAAIHDSTNFIANFPKTYSERYKKIRVCSIKRFPYSIYYRVYRKWVSVLAVYHHSRNPRFLRRIK